MRPVEIVSDYKNTITAELDLSREAANASHTQFSRQKPSICSGSFLGIHIKECLCDGKNICVPVNDIETLKSSNISLKVLAEKGVETFFTQVFEDNFFHADMHPGNIFILSVYLMTRPIFRLTAQSLALNEKEQYYLVETYSQ